MVVERLHHLYELVPGPRFDLAIEQLQQGAGFVFNGVWFRKEGTTLNVEAVASNHDVTQDAAAAGQLWTAAGDRRRAQPPEPGP